MATVQCKIDIPQVEGLEENVLTVGREFILVCDGEFSKEFVTSQAVQEQAEKLQFVLKPEEKYQIKILNFEFRSPTQAEIKVTAYKPGSFQHQDLQLSDGANTLSLGPIQYEVQSVMPPPDPTKGETKQEPYGPIGPAPLPIPMEYWAILAAFIAMLVLIGLTKVYRVVQRRNMLARLKEHDSALAPLPQLHQSLRGLQRKNTVFFGIKASKEDIAQCMDESHRIFRLYLTRKFNVPAYEWSDRLILKDIKRYYPHIYRENSPELKNLLKEFSRGIQDKDNLKESDVLNLTTHMRILAEKMERTK